MFGVWGWERGQSDKNVRRGSMDLELFAVAQLWEKASLVVKNY